MRCKCNLSRTQDQLILTSSKRLGYSRKGWTDCKLAVLWLTHFEKYTVKKANGHARLLVVDGHNSHYSFEFLDYACAHRIHVLCYLAHTTHVYQGLDVIVFSVLKQCWAEERTKWEANGGEVSKETFLTIYGAAHIQVLSPELVKKAFEKTGIWPFNPNVIPAEMMAPSKETSQSATFHSPHLPPSVLLQPDSSMCCSQPQRQQDFHEIQAPVWMILLALLLLSTPQFVNFKAQI